MQRVNRRVAPPQLPADLTPGALPPTVLPPPASGLSRSWRWAARFCGELLLTLGLTTLVVWGGVRYVTTSPRFALREIDLQGAHRHTVESLCAEGGVAFGANLFSIPLDEVRARLLADPWVREVTLTRRLPKTLRVQLQERQAAALLATSPLQLVSEEGELFPAGQEGLDLNLPVITGLSMDALREDPEGMKQTLLQVLALRSAYDHGPLSPAFPLQEVAVVGEGAYTLRVGADPFSLVVGAPPFRKKLVHAAQVLAELHRRKEQVTALFLGSTERPDRVIARVRR